MRDTHKERETGTETETAWAVSGQKLQMKKALGKSWLGMYRGLHAEGAHSDFIVSLLSQTWHSSGERGPARGCVGPKRWLF